jgi:hypothetical protein
MSDKLAYQLSIHRFDVGDFLLGAPANEQAQMDLYQRRAEGVKSSARK